MRVCVYTSIYGVYDQLKVPPPQSMEADFVCFTEQPLGKSYNGWRIVQDNRLRGHHPRIRAKYFKVRSDRIFTGLYSRLHGLSNYDVTIWIDGSVQITSKEFVREMLGFVRRFGLAMFIHPDRDCIYDEAQISSALKKYVGLPIHEQVETYRRLGYPAHNGLMACGLIVRMMKNPTLQTINRDWWHEIVTRSYQDQLSMPFVLWKHFFWYDEIRLPQRNNHLFRLIPHASEF